MPMLMWVVTGAALALANTVLALGPACAAGATAGSPLEFDPHRAVYDIQLEKTAPGSTIAALDGRMIFELSGNRCAGYRQILRFVSRTTNQDGAAQVNDLQTESWENGAATKLTFKVENFQDGALAEISEGTAVRAAETGPVRLSLRHPNRKSVTLPGNPLFPVAHLKSVVRAADQSKPLVASMFFDGSESGQDVYETTSVLGKKSEATALTFDASRTASPVQLAETSDSWPIATSYYKPGAQDGDGTPAFEMSYRLHRNGVTSAFTIDHGDFAFKGNLRRLEFTAPAGCR